MGLGLDFAAGEGPRFAHPVRTEDDVRRLAVPDMDKLRYVFDAVVIRRELDGKVPLIGFAGSPWTIACYMVEGQGSDDYRLIKTMLYARPDLLHHPGNQCPGHAAIPECADRRGRPGRHVSTAGAACWPMACSSSFRWRIPARWSRA